MSIHLYNHNKTRQNHTENQESSWCQLCTHCWHLRLSWCQLPVPPLDIMTTLGLNFSVHMHLIWESLYRIDSVMYWTGVRGSNGTWVTMATESTWSLSEQINKAFCCPCVIDTKLHKYKLQIKVLVTVGLVTVSTLVWYQYPMVFGDTYRSTLYFWRASTLMAMQGLMGAFLAKHGKDSLAMSPCLALVTSCFDLERGERTGLSEEEPNIFLFVTFAGSVYNYCSTSTLQYWFLDCKTFLSHTHGDKLTWPHLISFYIHYIQRIYTEFCYFLSWLDTSPIYPYPSGLLHGHWGIHVMAPVLEKQNCKLWICKWYDPTKNL